MTQCNVCCKLQVVRNTGYVALLAMSGLSRKFSDFTWTLRVYIQHVNIYYGWWRYAVHKYWISLLLQSQTTSFLVHNVHKKGHNKVWNAARLSLITSSMLWIATSANGCGLCDWPSLINMLLFPNVDRIPEMRDHWTSSGFTRKLLILQWTLSESSILLLTV